MIKAAGAKTENCALSDYNIIYIYIYNYVYIIIYRLGVETKGNIRF